jgi:MipA family protein
MHASNRLTTLAVLALASLVAQAAVTEPTPSTLTLKFGAAQSHSSLTGAPSDETKWQPLFAADYQNGPYFLSTTRGAGYQLAAADWLTGFVALGVTLGRTEGKAKDAPHFVGMGKVRSAGSLNVGVDVAPLGEALHLSAVTMVSTDRDQGYSSRLGATLMFPVVQSITGYVDAGLTRADRKHAQTFYGVTTAQSLKSGNPIYTPKAGWVSSEASVGANWALSKQWSLDASVGRQQWRGVAASSPLYTKQRNPMASLSASYLF